MPEGNKSRVSEDGAVSTETTGVAPRVLVVPPVGQCLILAVNPHRSYFIS